MRYLAGHLGYLGETIMIMEVGAIFSCREFTRAVADLYMLLESGAISRIDYGHQRELLSYFTY